MIDVWGAPEMKTAITIVLISLLAMRPIPAIAEESSLSPSAKELAKTAGASDMEIQAAGRSAANEKFYIAKWKEDIQKAKDDAADEARKKHLTRTWKG